MKIQNISLAGALVVFASCIYSLVDPLFVSLFGLGSNGYILGAIFSLVAAILIFVNMKKNSQALHESIIALGIIQFFALVSLQSFSRDVLYILAAAVVLVSICISLIWSMNSKGLGKWKFFALFLFLFVLSFMFFQNLYAIPSTEIARGSGTVLSDAWWESLNWIKDNTPECTVVATYWDPGHFIRAIAKRGVVFDGATQGAVRTMLTNETENGLVITPYEHGIKHIKFYSGGNITTSRINDIAISLMTPNESLAIDILEKYRVPGCDSMYYIASSDLIGKSTWWTYFSTWDPTVSKGTPSNYFIANLANVRPLLNQDALVYTYPVGQNQAFVVIGNNDTFRAFIQQSGSQPVSIENFIYYSSTGEALLITDRESPIKGTFLLQPDKRVAIFIPPELQQSMFTRMFLFNGAGLQNFEFVNQWGGEVKLFKVNFPDNETVQGNAS